MSKLETYKSGFTVEAKIFEKGDEHGFMPGGAGDPDIPFVNTGLQVRAGDFGKFYFIDKGMGLADLRSIEDFEGQFRKV